MPLQVQDDQLLTELLTKTKKNQYSSENDNRIQNLYDVLSIMFSIQKKLLEKYDP